MLTKQCTTCHIEKSTTEFSKSKRGKFGVRSTCKCCEKQYQQNNQEQIAERMKQYQQANKEQIAEYNKQYRQTPKGKAVDKAKSHNRRAAKLNNGGKHTAKEILALFKLQSGKCPYCKTKLSKSGSNKYHVDHVMPLSKGGTNDISNIQLLCPKCNMSKSDKLPEEFAQQHGKLL